MLGADRPPAEEDVMVAERALRRAGGLALSVLTISMVVTPGLAADSSNEAWAALAKGGHVALIRHGNAPPGYGGDPPGFRLDDCKTQRNLDDVGREQARALGEAFRKHGVVVGRIVSSPVCRCVETGQLMAVGSVETSLALVPDLGSTAVRVLELEELVSSWRGPGTLVLVTHGLAVGRLTGFTLEQAGRSWSNRRPRSSPSGIFPEGEASWAGSRHPRERDEWPRPVSAAGQRCRALRAMGRAIRGRALGTWAPRPRRPATG